MFDSLGPEAGRVPEQKQPSVNAVIYLFHILLSNNITERLQTTFTYVILGVQVNMLFRMFKLSSGFRDKNAYRNFAFKIILQQKISLDANIKFFISGNNCSYCSHPNK